ncbi:menaquinol-cytochrome c reductase cytochrome b subunit [Streptomyces spinoverrucosus]|uniref:Cytochrome bc1 complex cytochrome b subunit n=1 Tax=Streptomyces spinoverrucosus TaxID=284043 RepID=A0A4Y3VEJ7_9ACTN|nr:menaquinol-cytochrome c reductase cytochrome b subunit [Streptomyces spinoverrucosus]GHB78988.1 menaquinol-cytochrome c reductase cytochrome b subunit [Streptomyces spinoverrucosus]
MAVAGEDGSSRSTARGERVVSALDKRLPVSQAGREFLRKAFPDHWSFLLGEIALYSLLVLVATGVFLAFFFHPSMAKQSYTGSYEPLQGVLMSEAFASVMHISFDVRGGLLIRQIHHWGALVFVAAICVHLLRIFFTGAFRRPREANWTIGVTLFLLAVLEGFCGYSLPDDLLSGTGLRTTQGIVLSIPVVGTYLSFFVFGGQFPGHEIIPRLYVAHILLLPGLLLALVTVHLTFIVYHKHTQWALPGRTNRNVIGKPFYPQYTTKSLGLFFAVAGVLTLLAALLQINPIWAFGPYRADQVSIGSQPDWYVGFLEGALRLMPAAETDVAGHTVVWDVFLPGVVLPVTLFLVLYSYPYFERWITGPAPEQHLCDRPRNQPTRTALGVAAVSAYAVLLMAGGQDVIAFVFGIRLEWVTYTLRTALLVLPFLAYHATKRACLGLQAADRGRLLEGRAAAEVRQTADGGYQQARTLLPPAEVYRILVRDEPRPRAHGTEVWRWFRKHRIRNALSRWYFGKRVELPATDWQRQRVELVRAAPGAAEEADDT